MFVTNAVLCLPLDARGNNRPPKRAERANCAAHLAATIDLVDPRLIVTLGATALAALRHVSPHGLALCTAASTPLPWNGRLLVPLYHTAQRAQVHRDWVDADRGLARARDAGAVVAAARLGPAHPRKGHQLLRERLPEAGCRLGRSGHLRPHHTAV